MGILFPKEKGLKTAVSSPKSFEMFYVYIHIYDAISILNILSIRCPCP